MHRWTQILAVIGLLVAAPPGHGTEPAEPVPAEGLAQSTEEMLEERTLGDDDAPVTIIEHSSLTCGHCAAFHRDTLPLIRERYIETGKVRLVYSDFPLDTAALAAAMLARCAPRDRYFEFLDTLYREQDNWMRSDTLLEDLSALARDAGLTDPEIRACLSNGRLMTGLRENALAARDAHDVQATPTLVIDGEVVAGALPFERFQEIIERKLGDGDKATDAAPPPVPQAAQ